ncbi:hypothetical protein ES319_A13G176500v1 [Gossypium barbadense]|uniref:Uncharacterized protein n=1 Tax=Gossypium barbadense TaxID=3634 RepID=A0A5J5T0S9_GOSBA|nr:hypothetical protein ES319_A13G176500v1 [Gossypium barbadense]
MEEDMAGLRLLVLKMGKRKPGRSTLEKIKIGWVVSYRARWPATALAAEGSKDSEECWPDLGHLQRGKREKASAFFFWKE